MSSWGPSRPSPSASSRHPRPPLPLLPHISPVPSCVLPLDDPDTSSSLTSVPSPGDGPALSVPREGTGPCGAGQGGAEEGRRGRRRGEEAEEFCHLHCSVSPEACQRLWASVSSESSGVRPPGRPPLPQAPEALGETAAAFGKETVGDLPLGAPGAGDAKCQEPAGRDQPPDSAPSFTSSHAGLARSPGPGTAGPACGTQAQHRRVILDERRDGLLRFPQRGGRPHPAPEAEAGTLNPGGLGRAGR